MPRRRKLLILVCLAFSSARASASELENPNFLPFGEQEAFLGNAGIALEGSSGAVYYNPAALAYVTTSKASVYGNAYAFNRLSLSVPTGTGNPDSVLSSNSYTGVPLSTVTVFGGGKFTYAFSVNTPFASQLNISAPIQGAGININLKEDTSESSLWIGPSFAAKVSESLALGASLFVSRFSSTLNEVVAIQSTSSIVGGLRATIDDWSALLVLGAQLRLSEEWGLGLRVQTPSLDIRGRTDYFAATQSTAGGQQIDDQSGIYSRFRRPLNFGIGAHFSPSGTTEFLLDANAQLPVHFDTAPSRPTVTTRYDTNFAARGNFGAKFRLGPTHNLLAGFMLNPSTLPGTGSFGSTGTRETIKGATAGLQKDLGPLVTGMGGFFLWSSAQLNNSSTSQVANFSHQIFGVLLTASYKL